LPAPLRRRREIGCGCGDPEAEPLSRIPPNLRSFLTPPVRIRYTRPNRKGGFYVENTRLGVPFSSRLRGCVFAVYLSNTRGRPGRLWCVDSRR
jgi:hypothetical protein